MASQIPDRYTGSGYLHNKISSNSHDINKKTESNQPCTRDNQRTSLNDRIKPEHLKDFRRYYTHVWI